MAAEARSLSITSKLQDATAAGFGRMLTTGRGAASGLISAFKKAGAAIAAVTAAGGVAFVALRKVAEDLDKVAKSVDRLGVTAESLTAIRNGAELAGVSFEELVAAVQQFEKVVAEANDGSVNQRRALAEVGLVARDLAGEQLDLVDILGRVGDGLGSVSGAAERTALLMRLFGDQGAALSPLLAQGSTGIQRMADEARALGAVFTREELGRVEAFNDSWTKIQQSFRALAQQVAINLSPAFTKLFDTLNSYLQNNASGVRESIFDLSEVFLEVAKVLNYVVQTLQLAWSGLGLLIQPLQAVGHTMGGAHEEAQKLWREFDIMVERTRELTKTFGDTSALDAMIQRLRALRLQSEQGPFRIVVTASRGGDDEGKEPQPRGQVSLGEAYDRFAKGASEASRAWRDFAATAEQSGQQLVNGSLNALSDGIAEGIMRTKSWGEVWKQMGQNVLGILAQIIAKAATVQLVSQLFGSTSPVAAKANGGVEPGGITGVMPLQRFAMGGIAKGPTLALMGEGSAPAEAFVPLPDGKTIPVSFRGYGGGGGGQVINVTQVFNSHDARGAYELFKQNRGLIRQFMVDDMQRGNRAVVGAVRGASR